ncbi:MAG TPA: NAD-dependent epimerase/dehydratase family protein [Alphaproteobacteria bacterium]|nr:NAD-dependent epimerase/dehydratase family protein [Alphaproteobacteria bacterium]
MPVQLDKDSLVVVTGAGGFIGGQLVSDLRRRGFKHIRAVDIKPVEDWYQRFADVESRQNNLKDLQACYENCRGARYVFNLAADMGGMWFIERFKAECMLSVLISTNMLLAARDHSIERFFYSSSACVYNADKQKNSAVTALKEEDAYPALCEDGYGWEKLFAERMARHFMEDYFITTRVARYHNVFGPLGTYDGGREKAPAAICRKVALAKINGHNEIDIWGDGEQTRSFMYIDDCVEGSLRIMESDCAEPLNLGSDNLVSINQMVDIVEKLAGVKLKRNYVKDAPQGVRGRNSDNTRIKKELGWAPSITLQAGLEKTYAWIYDELKKPVSQRRKAFTDSAEGRYVNVADSGLSALAGLPKSLPPLGLFTSPEQARKFAG